MRSRRSRTTLRLGLVLLLGGGGAQARGILTQGGAAPAPVTASVAANMVGAAQGAAMATQAQNNLARMTRALTAMKTMQSAARSLTLAAPDTTPNGLQLGGLVPDSGLAAPGVARPVTTWQNARTPVQTTAAGRTTVSVEQTAAQAILSWNSFNVSKTTTVNFNQHGNSSWVALNQIGGGVPSQIRGAIKASGQVYLINPNGIIFGGASQVNVGALIASSASLSSSQFLANGIYSTSANLTYAPSFTAAGGPVTVQAGAEITTSAPATVTAGGGFVMLLGTQVQNAGVITTPNGQTMLAAGDNFLVRAGFGTDSNGFSTTRGNEVAVRISKHSGSGLVGNSGLVTATTGDITLAGENVVQSGVLLSTTTVSVRGTIHLLSAATDANSSVTLTGGSLTSVTPDLASTITALDSQRAGLIANSVAEDGVRGPKASTQFNDLSLLNDREDESRVEIVTGGSADFQVGSQTVATGGQVAVSAAKRVQVDTGASIDVAGRYGVALPVAANDLAVSIQSFEQRDDPQNRLTQNLRNNTVYVDARTLSVVPASPGGYPTTRDYTSGGLLEVSGYLNTQGHTIGEWTALGGSIALSTGKKGVVVAQPGATFDLAGGSVSYQGGEVRQSYLRGSDGRIYNIDNAPADVTYAGVFNGFDVDHPSWGQTETFGGGLHTPAELYEQGYTVGRAAGSLTLASPTTLFAGTIDAGVVNGLSQTKAPPAGTADPYTLGQTVVAAPGTLVVAKAGSVTALPTNTNVTFAAAPTATASLATPVAERLQGSTVFDAAALDRFGLGGLYVLTNGSINVAAPLTLSPAASVSLFGSAVSIAADVSTASGSVSAGNIATVGGTDLVLQANSGKHRGNIIVGDNVTISTRGLWSNLSLDPSQPSGGAFINGGPVSLRSVSSLSLRPGSAIDASAGAVIAANGAATGGAGGAISLSVTALTAKSRPGTLSLQGSLQSIGVTTGGALSIAAPNLQIADAAAQAKAGVTVLMPAFFQSGFSSYTLVSVNGLIPAKVPKADHLAIAPGTVINVLEPTYDFTEASALMPTGAAPTAGFRLALNPLYTANPTLTAITQRPGASFSLTASTISLGAGAEINVDPAQTIKLVADGQITIDGALSAPGGTIDIYNTLTDDLLPKKRLTSIWFGSSSRVSTAAQAFTASNAAGARLSLAPAGGGIYVGDNGALAPGLVAAGGAAVIAQAGAVFDASGSAAVDQAVSLSELRPGVTAARPNPALPVEGAGGTILLASTRGLYVDAALRAAAGGPDAAGGTLALALPTDLINNAQNFEDFPRILTITGTGAGPKLPAKLKPGAPDAALVKGTGQISATQIAAGGFGSLSFDARDAFLFKGNVTLAAPLSIQFFEGALSETNRKASVLLATPYVLLSGQTERLAKTGFNVTAVTGFSRQHATGSFTVDADLIDVQNTLRFGGIKELLTASGKVRHVDLADFGNVVLNSQGDLRFLQALPSGAGDMAPATTLVTTGNIDLTASRIYATGNPQTLTAGSGVVEAGYDEKENKTNGSLRPGKVLTIGRPANEPAAAPPLVLGGALTFLAATIKDNGTIWQPLGSITFGDISTFAPQGAPGEGDPRGKVELLPGSLTSVSAAGLTIPFGGTTDGVNYLVNGNPVVAATSTGSYRLASVSNGVAPGTISIAAFKTIVDQGAVLNLSGGGNLTGAGFISGQGGSVNVLAAPFLHVGATGGVTQPALATDPVYAIVAGPQQPVAPNQLFAAAAGAGSMPALGAQIVVPAGVPGLAAGRYTLLPALYALNPGGYRVEFGGAAAAAAPPVLSLPNGSYAVAATTATINTPLRSTLPSKLTITPAAAVLNDAQYDTESYSTFLQNTAARFGNVRPVLPADGATLTLQFPALRRAELVNAGASNFAAAAGGVGGTLVVSGAAFPIGGVPRFDLYGAAPEAKVAANTVSLSAAALDTFNPFIMQIGIAGAGSNAETGGITLETGATLNAGRVVLTALTHGVTLKGGAAINTVGRGTLFEDSTEVGKYQDGGASVLDIGNGYLSYASSNASSPDYGPISIDDGATIYTDGSIAFSTQAAVKIGMNAIYGGRYLDLAVPEINIGDAAALGAVAPVGLTLTQPVLQRLTNGVPELDVPGVQVLVLAASDSLNFYGNTGIDLNRGDVQLVIDSPAIYGFGKASDVATVNAGTIVWNGTLAANDNGSVSALPGGAVANGPGSGTGTLNFTANTIVFGYSSLDTPLRDVPLDRLALGFSAVNLNAGEITANNQGTLAVYEDQPVYGQPGQGGVLSLNTRLLTADNEARIGFTAGGALNLNSAGAAPAAPAAAAGAEIDLGGNTVTLNGAIRLPSGKLDITGANDISFGTGAAVDLAGGSRAIFDKTVYGFGGTLIAESAAGNISEATGASLDVSATDNNAGAVTLTATRGVVALNGTLNGASTDGASGAFDARANTIGDFTALNNALNAGGFFQARSFDVRTGNLTVGTGVRAHAVSIAADAGHLDITGLINASGGGAGSISLAGNSLTLGTDAVLDAHGTVLATDSDGQPIAAVNAPAISLTAATGELVLTSGSRIDLASADGVARGDLVLNVPRLRGVTSGDANIAAGNVNITGAASIAVNAFQTYHGLTDKLGTADGQPDALITQAYLDRINTTDSQPYMAAAAVDTDLAGRLAGLSSYGSAFHFRPGVQIVSATPDGDLTVQGDIDLAGYRYGPGIDPATYGSGEPGVLTIRAGGTLNIFGSITDGFNQPISDAGTAYAKGWDLYTGADPYNHNYVVPSAVTLAKGSDLGLGATVNYAAPITGGTFAANSVAPVALTVAGSTVTSLAFVATSAITSAKGKVLFAKGALVPAGSRLPPGARIGAGGLLPFDIKVGKVTWPANTPFTITADDGLDVTLSKNLVLLPGSLIPANSNILFTSKETVRDGEAVATRPVGADGTQGQLYPLARLLPQGDLSWSIQLVGGADTKAADGTEVQAASTLATASDAGDITLADTHYGRSEGFPVPAFSVVRTGTGTLRLAAGGAINEESDYGIYTAGAQAPAILNAASANPHNLPQGKPGAGSTLLGPGNAKLAKLEVDYQANYPTGGGDVALTAQGDLNGFISTMSSPNNNNDIVLTDTDAIGSWLWRQGGAGQPGAWWVEYGALRVPPGNVGAATTPPVEMDGFQGIGTLGGGNLTVDVGGNAGGLNLVVASNGRTLPNGTVAQNGGGNLDVSIGGAVNFATPSAFGGLTGDAGGLISDLRGNADFRAGSIGTIQPDYLTGNAEVNDPRFAPPLATEAAVIESGIDLAPGDGSVTIATRGDQVIDAASNPGTVQNLVNTTPVTFTKNGKQVSKAAGGSTDFSLWSATTSIGLQSAGGDVTPSEYNNTAAQNDTADTGTAIGYYPPTLAVTAESGNIDFIGGTTELAPAAGGQLSLLAAGSILGTANSPLHGAALATSAVISMSGADPAALATPLDPLITVLNGGGVAYTNASPSSDSQLLPFGPDTPDGDLHQPGQAPALAYAEGGDIVNLQFGYVLSDPNLVPTVRYVAAKPFDIMAARDIVNSGTPASPSVFLNLSPSDITTVSADRDILQSSADIAGPGTLLVQAGRNVYQADQGVLESVGPVFDIVPTERDSGAGVSVIAGAGQGGPNYASFQNLYLNPASDLSLQNAGQIIAGNNQLLDTWLRQVFGYTGRTDQAYAKFLTLSPTQQDIFLRQLYFSELNKSGIEFNQPASPRYKSYALGRTAIAALFPSTGVDKLPISYAGDLTLFGNSGIHTDFGGAIQTLTPGGATTIGVEGAAPLSSAGYLTEGSGDIDIYSLNSVLLGESRVLTTFGGNILIWSAAGDINAGRGSKTTIDYAPVQRVYDAFGNVTLSPNVPSSGAGIGTLNPIPQIAPGDVNLIAPLGTVDAGEAGIRASANLNIAALHVLNAANITVQGATTGVPATVAPNVGALTAASNASGAAVQAAETAGRPPIQTAPPSIWIVEILGYGGGSAVPDETKRPQHGAGRQS